MKQIHIIGGGTVSYLASHLAVSAPAYGSTARKLHSLCQNEIPEMDSNLVLTRMAGGSKDLQTNEDVSNFIDFLVDIPETKIIFMTAALVDFGSLEDLKHGKRYDSHGQNELNIKLHALPKIVNKIRKKRKDIFLVAFKQTEGLTEDQQYVAGLRLCKEASANLVLANDVGSTVNMIITPEEARYHVSTDRSMVLENLVEMAYHRSQLTFTRSTVVDGKPISWDSDLVPESLRTIVNYCIQENAYKPFQGKTVGHFAVKLNDQTFLTSIRKSNFNDLDQVGLVMVKTDGPDNVTAYGAKPSVGGQSQRIVFGQHQEYDCILHFHTEMKDESKIPVVSQRLTECGSHQCGINTSKGLQKFGNLSAVFLDNHGPNIVFHHSIDPMEVINFIEENFDLTSKTGGLVDVAI